MQGPFGILHSIVVRFKAPERSCRAILLKERLPNTMKSLVEEASSVVKAIEKAWNRAGCPQTFSVKIFETPETNFFGFTKKSAKVGIFFEEEPAPQQRKYTSQSRDQKSQGAYRSQSKGRNDASYSREREEKEDDLVQIESRRAHHNGRQANQGQRTNDRDHSSDSRHAQPTVAATAAPVQRQESAHNNDRQDRQPSRERPQRPNNRPTRTNDRELEEQPRQTRSSAPIVEQEQRQESRYEQPRREQQESREYTPRQDREFEPRREREFVERNDERPRDNQEEGSRERAPRNDRRDGDRRSSSRGGDRRDNRGGRNNRPERAQRHEFDEQRPAFNSAPEDHHSQPVHEQSQLSSAPEIAQAPVSLAPQKKVLKVSGRRYSAPVKKTDE